MRCGVAVVSTDGKAANIVESYTTVYCVTKITQIRILDNKLFHMIKRPSASHQYNIKQSKGHRLNFQEHLFYIEEL